MAVALCRRDVVPLCSDTERANRANNTRNVYFYLLLKTNASHSHKLFKGIHESFVRVSHVGYRVYISLIKYCALALSVIIMISIFA